MPLSAADQRYIEGFQCDAAASIAWRGLAVTPHEAARVGTVSCLCVAPITGETLRSELRDYI